LQRLLEPRLAAAARPREELESVAQELQVLGRRLVLDEDDAEWTIYADLPGRNLALWCHWSADGSTQTLRKLEVLWQKM